MALPAVYLPKYANSRALVIGVDRYRNAPPLMHACNDAKAVAAELVTRFRFPKGNVDLLLDADATRATIMSTFHRYTNSNLVKPDDRILVFYAGHGHTVTGRRGETGFLVPVDGDVSDLSSLIRWDELTRNADLIAAKHMLFLMDACYGGLALTRTIIPPGSMRLLKDMLQRYSRQVLTAGKADEVVSDSGGTRAGHSIFTSYVLDGMEGAAAPSGGPITGHNLMAYVYTKVGNDPHSRQTPHFGFFDGDGDFIFDTSALSALQPKATSEPEPDFDLLIKTPAFSTIGTEEEDSVAAILKRLIANPSEKIRLDDFVSTLIRKAQANLSLDIFPTTGIPVTPEDFTSRVKRYEDAIAELLIAVVLLARWGEQDQLGLLEKILSRIAENDKPQAGTIVWLRLYWYPVLLLMYATGICALATKRFQALKSALLTPIYSDQHSNRTTTPIILPTVGNLTEIVSEFKLLPDMEKKYVPRSEHIFKKLQPVLEDQLFLGRAYDALFDEFEIILALTYADLRDEDVNRHVWGPPGRFAWKERGRDSDAVYTRFVDNAKNQDREWGPIRSGFFRQSARRFSDVADAYGKLLSRINWW